MWWAGKGKVVPKIKLSKCQEVVMHKPINIRLHIIFTIKTNKQVVNNECEDSSATKK